MAGRTRLVLCGLVATVTAAGVTAQQMEITRSTVDGGGVMQSTSARFALSGTIGQPDAGVMSSRSFTVTGGFWFGLDAGDCNDDGLINRFDFLDYLSCLFGPHEEFDDSLCSCFDLDSDEDITIADFAQLQRQFTGP